MSFMCQVQKTRFVSSIIGKESILRNLTIMHEFEAKGIVTGRTPWLGDLPVSCGHLHFCSNKKKKRLMMSMV